MDYHFKPFVIPFSIGVAVLFAVIIYKYARWFWRLPAEDKAQVRRSVFTGKTVGAVGETVSEALLHRRIWRRNPLLGYMHTSLAFGWFLLIVVGWIETAYFLGAQPVPLHTHVFFKQFSTHMNHDAAMPRLFSAVMDLLLLLVLSGVALAWFKRMRSRAMGMKRTTKHTPGDRVALSALWFIFPARLLAESATSGLHHSGGFLTGLIGRGLLGLFGENALATVEPWTWWFYSLCLGVFLVAMPFSRYMHIFTEVPLIFLRRWGLRSRDAQGSYDRFQIEACSRCGICIDPCQLLADGGMGGVQSVYFLRDLRHGKLTDYVAGNCLMCGRCETACPVGIELNTLRLSARHAKANTPADGRYDYLAGLDRSSGEGKVGYFAGCMTLLTPRILQSMESIFMAAGENVWWADREGGVCCGRPLKLSGETDAAAKMVDYNRELFYTHGITTLVTSCPICLKVFREDYSLEGIEVLHHSQYIARLIEAGRIPVAAGSELYTYHDPCELGRGSGIYDEPREVIRSVGALVELSENRAQGLCCGSSIADTAISDGSQAAISEAMAGRIAATGAAGVVTACPLCKKAVARSATVPVWDLAEVVSRSLQS
jgi:Fe-S oxidoreductase